MLKEGLNMKLSQWLKYLYTTYGLKSVSDFTFDQKHHLQFHYGVFSLDDIMKCDVLIKLIAEGKVDIADSDESSILQRTPIMPTQNYKETITDIIAGKDCPLPIEIIPNNMGINLCSVDSIEWRRQDDGQLVDIKINFIPNNE